MVDRPGNDVSSVRVVRVFLASPSDLGQERRLARIAIDEINKTVARPAGIHMDLIGWEDTLSAAGRPQALINEDLEGCQMFIGMLWSRWGTPPDIGGKYTSGFEEEFDLATTRFSASGSPHITLLFKDVEQSKLNDAGPELSKVISFKEKVIAEKRVLFETFQNPEELAQRVRFTAAAFIHRLSAAEQPSKQEGATGDIDSTDIDADRAQSQEKGSSNAGSVSSFLTEISQKVELDTDLDATDIARLRNISVAHGRPSNDDITIGAHDANLIYAQRNKLTLSSTEISALADAGVEAWKVENRPLWTWLKDRNDATPTWLSYTTLFGPNVRRVGAINLLTALEWQMVEDEFITAERIEQYWFGDDSPESVTNAALQYIGCPAGRSLLPLAEKELSKASYATQKTALEAIIASLARVSHKDAARYAIDASFDVVGNDQMNVILAGMAELDEAALTAALDHRSGTIHAQAISLLSEQDKISEAQTRRFFGDTAIAARKSAVAAFEKGFGELAEDDLKHALVLKETQGLFGTKSSDHVGQAAFEELREMRRARRPASELRHAMVENSFAMDDHYLTVADIDFAREANNLRRNIDDRFVAFWDRYVVAISNKYGTSDSVKSLQETLNKHSELRRRQLTRLGLNVIVKHSHKQDLARLRRALDDNAIDPRATDIKLFERWGSDEDIQRIANIASDYRAAGSPSTLLAGDNLMPLAAKAILKIIGNRIESVLSLDLSSKLLAHVFATMSMTSFRGLSQTFIEQALNSKADEVRKAVALQLLNSIGTREARSYLARYTELGKHRYYNVVFWLDLAQEWTRGMYRPLVRRQLQELVR